MKLAYVVSLAGLLSGVAYGAKPVPKSVEIPQDGIVAGTINGRPARLWVSPKGSKVPLLNPDAAKQAGLTPGWLKGVLVIGPVRVPVNTGVVRYTAPGTDLKRRVGGLDRTIAPRADAMVGPAGLSAPVVVFRIAPTRPGERIIRMPLIDDGYSGLKTEVRFGKDRVKIDWRLDDDATVATASAGALLADRLGGNFVGQSNPRHVLAGVSRPHRVMKLARPLMVGGRETGSLFVRTSAHDTDTSDPNEIIVVAKGKGERKAPRMVTFGRDALHGCSTLTFDKPRKEVRLSCL